jgi:hypothetical protein
MTAMRSALLVAAFLALAQAPPPVASPDAPQKTAEPERVQAHDVPDDEDDDDEDETPWMLYASIAGFVVFGAVIFLVVSRGNGSRKA